MFHACHNCRMSEIVSPKLWFSPKMLHFYLENTVFGHFLNRIRGIPPPPPPPPPASHQKKIVAIWRDIIDAKLYLEHTMNPYVVYVDLLQAMKPTTNCVDCIL